MLDDFELVRRIGVGGMGQVYLARQKSLKRQVAIKILRAELAANATALRRFKAEAEAVANITHAHIVQVYMIGEADGLHYMALEYVDGRNLRDFLEKKGIPDLPMALEIMRQVAAALERAGELGFVHRDIKPENILLSKKGEVKVTDFGLSRCFGNDAPIHLTQSGVTMGTPLYMSPEQVRGQAVDPRSDIYSFGVTCYHMIGGEPPFRGTTAFDVALQHVQAEPRPLASLRPDLPPELCAIVHKMMAKRPEDRYQSAREILNDLARFRDGALASVAMPAGSAVFAPAFGNSSTHVPALAPTQTLTQPLPTRSGSWRYAVLAGLALAAAAGGAALQWAQSAPAAAINPEDALADVDPDPAVLRERELKRKIHDREIYADVRTDALLELAELLIDDHKPDEALRLFDANALRALMTGAQGLNQHQLIILGGLGRGIVLAHQDMAEQSNDEFLKLVRTYPPLLAKDVPPPKKAGLAPKGQLEQFFFRSAAGANWKRAVGEALDRNAKNLGGKMPDDLKRLRMLPAKGPLRP
ncbi:MAG TPA: serine/threonine-protein kinase [Gemmataceae bacterium]|nr:serine/threonine-protein kinase [Gemmataceae bacterium]